MEEYILYLALALAFLSFVFFLVLNIRFGKMMRKYKNFMHGLGDKDVEQLMTYYLNDLDKLKNEVHENMNDRIEKVESRMPQCIQNVGIVHYNAFDNVGNEMSFSAAMLDENQDGFILTGIYSRENSYVYSKEIVGGKPQRELSREEIEAMNKAILKLKDKK